MKSFLTDENNDLYLNGQNQVATGSDNEAIAQIVINALRTIKGELQLNIDSGVPYFETIFNKNPDIQLWQGFMIEEAEKIDGVIKVDSMDITIDDDQLSYEMKIKTIYGEISVKD